MKYGSELDLSKLEKIELRKSSEFRIAIDGRIEEGGKTIIVTSKLYDTLPCLSIDELEKCKDFRTIVYTLFHEMGHLTDMTKYPILYGYASDENEELSTFMPAFFWVEYLAENRSYLTGLNDKIELCEGFVNIAWKPNTINFEYPYDNNFFWLNKSLVYFLVGTSKPEIRKRYLKRIKNELRVEYINELWDEILRLDGLLPFDEIDNLANMYGIMNKYYKSFCLKYCE